MLSMQLVVGGVRQLHAAPNPADVETVQLQSALHGMRRSAPGRKCDGASLSNMTPAPSASRTLASTGVAGDENAATLPSQCLALATY